MNTPTKSFYSNSGKRIFDLLVSFTMLIILSPVFIFSALLVFFSDGLPIIHKRECLGESRNVFWMYKFRTMIIDADEVLEEWKERNDQKWIDYEKNIKLGNDPRLLFFGNFMRSLSIDEIPQLLNVLLGSMSLIGPRPIAETEEHKIEKENLKKRYFVKPGITGLWQVSGRQDTSYKERQKLDSEYVDNISFLNDIRIILKTVVVVFQKKGAY